MMSCRELIDFLLAYHAGELPQEERAAFDRHLAVCPPCVAYVESYDQTVKLCAAAREAADTGAAGFPQELIDAILAARRASAENKSD